MLQSPVLPIASDDKCRAYAKVERKRRVLTMAMIRQSHHMRLFNFQIR